MGTDAGSHNDAAAAGTSATHNPSVDDDASAQGGCAQVHLPTGRMCTLQRGHQGSCEFSSPEDADDSLATHKADEAW